MTSSSSSVVTLFLSINRCPSTITVSTSHPRIELIIYLITFFLVRGVGEYLGLIIIKSASFPDSIDPSLSPIP